MKILGLLICLISLSTNAAISNKTKNALRSSAILRGDGAIHGGVAGLGFSLMGVQTKVAKSKKLERLTVSIGDANFQTYKGSPGYFHIENSKTLNQVVINFSQTPNSKFDEKSLQKAFAQSPFVKNSQMTFDPQTQTTSLILKLKKPVSLRAIPQASNGKQLAQVRIDLFEDDLLNKKRK